VAKLLKFPTWEEWLSDGSLKFGKMARRRRIHHIMVVIKELRPARLPAKAWDQRCRASAEIIDFGNFPPPWGFG
jgi:hypothetical protein